MPELSKFQIAIKKMSKEELSSYAAKSGTTVRYLLGHLYYRTKEPRKPLRAALAENSEDLTITDILEHFHITQAQAQAGEDANQ